MKTYVLVCVVSFYLSATSQCFAGVASTGGSVSVIPPPASAVNGSLTSNTESRLFTEKTNFRLDESLSVDVTKPGVVESFPDLTPGVISAGTLVDSYLLATDTLGGTAVVPFRGTIAFDVPILGILVQSSTLDLTDQILGADSTIYLPSNPFRGFDGPTFSSSSIAVRDLVDVSGDRQSLTFEFLTGQFNDQIRIVTASIPEPTSLSLLILASLAAFLQLDRNNHLRP